jgi:hypothetical protein
LNLTAILGDGTESLVPEARLDLVFLWRLVSVSIQSKAGGGSSRTSGTVLRILPV